MDGWYYLHTNGELIFKRWFEPEADSDFVKKVWPIDVTNRANAWTILIEGLAMGARVERVAELAETWGCTTHDLPMYLAHVTTPTQQQKDGLELFLNKIAHVDYDTWLDWLATTPRGQEPIWATMPRADLCKSCTKVFPACDCPTGNDPGIVFDPNSKGKDSIAECSAYVKKGAGDGDGKSTAAEA
jgi:hypothetical protein